MKKLFRNLAFGLILLFLYAPILVLIVYSFNDSKIMGPWAGFTLKWYVMLFQDYRYGGHHSVHHCGNHFGAGHLPDAGQAEKTLSVTQ